jgi:mRNA-degrading endonuclease RelE of RelBE toxin-antitoxin system
LLSIEYRQDFLKRIARIGDPVTKERVKRQIEKVVADPEIGKPMRYARKGTREVRITPYRLAYAYLRSEQRIIFLDLYHKDEQ